MQSSSLPLSAVFKRSPAGQRAALGLGPSLEHTEARLLLRLTGYTPLSDLLLRAELIDSETLNAVSRLASDGLIERSEDNGVQKRRAFGPR